LRQCFAAPCKNAIKRMAMVNDPGDYRWSSYRHHGFGAPDALLSAHEQYERLGSTRQQRQRSYRELFR